MVNLLGKHFGTVFRLYILECLRGVKRKTVKLNNEKTISTTRLNIIYRHYGNTCAVNVGCEHELYILLLVITII